MLIFYWRHLKLDNPWCCVVTWWKFDCIVWWNLQEAPAVSAPAGKQTKTAPKKAPAKAKAPVKKGKNKWVCELAYSSKKIKLGVRCQNVGQAGTVTTRLEVMQAKRGGMPVSIYTSQHGMPIKRDMAISYCRNFACFRIWLYHWSIQFLLWFVQSPLFMSRSNFRNSLLLVVMASSEALCRECKVTV